MIGLPPVEMAALPVDAAQTNAPADTGVVKVLMNAVSDACKRTTFTLLDAGFQTPRIGVAVAVSVIVLADSAVTAVEPNENRRLLRACSKNRPCTSLKASSPVIVCRAVGFEPRPTFC